ncbi:16S rRNA (cytosine967-C5)-methyltransferase [Pseudoxanthomonas japonensis]|uniref:16S rRNA (cytosine(967)-C(5))-methyltransferase RsmB n=1 Tax=Pseudoxanthomonas TaxID=83618 RepID=UPI0007838336|nr:MULTISPECIES: 16S rRNA (cytosine(967)-C(5))-methyltransferase RsmB [Pseudoxanthomonas]MDR7068302.1 16S rRNA (cytosine967-C5)-methyltransferase [Pseudoxanthomonas japonensis]
MTTQAGVAVRVLATRVVDAVMHRGRSLKAELATNLPRIEDVRDRALLEAMCFAVLRSRARSEAALAAWMAKPLGHADNELRALLHVGFAQLVVMELPPHAALSATVEAVRALGRPHQDKLVNALLRRAQREGLPAVSADALWPAWLRKQVREDWPEQADAIFAASQREAPLWLRVNQRRGTRDAYRQRLADVGIAAEPVDGMADALVLDAPVATALLPGFAEGDVSIQDGAAQRVADLFRDLPPGARVLDMCAAPGGKTAHLLERDPSLQVLALDVDERRLQRVRETLERVGLGAQMRAADATDAASWWDGRLFDAVLLDAPCSATGIVRRQPDVLLHRRSEDVAALAALQARMLDAAWRVLRPGGLLVYTTCSILRVENALQVETFFRRHADAEPVPAAQAWGLRDSAGAQRFPGEAMMDGFFYAGLRKRASA